MSEQNAELDDPDLQQTDSALEEVEDEGEEAEELASDTLDGDEDGTWEPDQHLSNATAELIEHGDRDEETLSERLAQEVPDVDATSGGDVDAERDLRQV